MEEFPKYLHKPSDPEDGIVVHDTAEEAAAGKDNYFWQGKAPKRAAKA